VYCQEQDLWYKVDQLQGSKSITWTASSGRKDGAPAMPMDHGRKQQVRCRASMGGSQVETDQDHFRQLSGDPRMTASIWAVKDNAAVPEARP
jgi:hypothetical protein